MGLFEGRKPGPICTCVSPTGEHAGTNWHRHTLRPNEPTRDPIGEGWRATGPHDFGLGAGSARLNLPWFQRRVVNPFVFYVLIFRSHAEDFQGLAG